MYISTNVCAFAHERICKHEYVLVCECVHVLVCLYICANMYTYMCACLHRGGVHVSVYAHGQSHVETRYVAYLDFGLLSITLV